MHNQREAPLLWCVHAASWLQGIMFCIVWSDELLLQLFPSTCVWCWDNRSTADKDMNLGHMLHMLHEKPHCSSVSNETPHNTEHAERTCVIMFTFHNILITTCVFQRFGNSLFPVWVSLEMILHSEIHRWNTTHVVYTEYVEISQRECCDAAKGVV